jgi:hypothetical protein
VGVVGCDGAGKSTLTADLIAALRQDGEVEFLYLGQSSGNIADWIRGLPLIGPPFGRYLVRRAERAHGKTTSSPDAAAALVMHLLSRWRAHKFRRMLALCRRGTWVVVDRYPQCEVPGFYFDGPGLDVSRPGSWLVRLLARREQRLYEWMASHVPSLVIRLNIDADTAHARKPDHKLSMLRDKVRVIPGLSFNEARIVDLDGRDPYPQVLDAALRAVRAAMAEARG